MLPFFKVALWWFTVEEYFSSISHDWAVTAVNVRFEFRAASIPAYTDLSPTINWNW
jgi:hypothetical protein